MIDPSSWLEQETSIVFQWVGIVVHDALEVVIRLYLAMHRRSKLEEAMSTAILDIFLNSIQLEFMRGAITIAHDDLLSD